MCITFDFPLPVILIGAGKPYIYDVRSTEYTVVDCIAQWTLYHEKT